MQLQIESRPFVYRKTRRTIPDNSEYVTIACLLVFSQSTVYSATSEISHTFDTKIAISDGTGKHMTGRTLHLDMFISARSMQLEYFF